MNEIFQAIRNNAVAIGIFAIVTAAVIAFTQLSTREKIAHNKAEFQARALYEIVPREIDPDLLAHEIQLRAAPELGYPAGITGWQAINSGEVVTVLLPVIAPDGYSGNIELLVGVNADSSLAGVRVLSHKETPGLGDKIELAKSDWILVFTGAHMGVNRDEDWAVKKDGGNFDQFTGATITPRAVVNATARAIEFFRAHRAQLLQPVTADAASAAGVTQ